MADLNSTIVRGNLRVTDQISGNGSGLTNVPVGTHSHNSISDPGTSYSGSISIGGGQVSLVSGQISAYTVRLSTNTLTEMRDIGFPNASGTLALTNVNNNFPATTFTGSLEIFSDNGNWAEGIRIHPSTNNWGSIVLCDSTNTSSNGTGAKTWSMHNNEGSFGIYKNGSNASATYYLRNDQSDGNWDIKGASYRMYYDTTNECIKFVF